MDTNNLTKTMGVLHPACILCIAERVHADSGAQHRWQ